MKKLMLIVVAICMLSLSACSISNSEASKPEIELTPNPTPTVKPEEIEQEEQEVSSEPEEETPDGFIGLPAIEAPAAFSNIYEGNYIDEEYLLALNSAQNLTDMIIICEDTSFSWRIAIDNIYSKLVEIMDEVQQNELDISHSAWSNDIQITISEIEDDVSELGSVGGFEAAQRIMYIYRNRTIELALIYYELTGEVILPPDIGEAVG